MHTLSSDAHSIPSMLPSNTILTQYQQKLGTRSRSQLASGECRLFAITSSGSGALYKTSFLNAARLQASPILVIHFAQLLHSPPPPPRNPHPPILS